MGAGKVLLEMVRFMQKNNVIQKRDFERYEVVIPFSHLAGKRRKQFLCSELEKMHPCFSDEFAFDSTIKKISRKGILQDVFVMNKYKLAEYERTRSVAGSGFLLETDKQGRRLFVGKKWKLLVGVILFCLIIGLITAFFFLLSGEPKITNLFSEDNTMLDSKFHVSENTSAKSLETVSSENDEFNLTLEKDFFSVVSVSKGIIFHFDWSLNQSKNVLVRKMSALVKGVYPEQLSELSNPVVNKVIYEDGIPKMTVSFTETFSYDGISEEESKSGSNSDFNKNFRKLLQEHNAILKEENAPPYHIEFVCDDITEQEKNTLIEKLADLISEDNRYISSISINQVSNNQLRFGISIESGNGEMTGFDLGLISHQMNLFFTAVKKPESKRDKSEITVNGEVNKKKNYQKIGEIKKNDGNLYVFYKNEDGKIKNIVKRKED